MFGRNIKTCLPEWNHETATCIEQEIIDNDQCANGKMKSYADKRRDTKEGDIKVGDKVLVVKPAGFRKKTYDPVPYTVTVINGSQITAEREGHKITRNSSFYKKIPSGCVPPTLSDEDTDSDYDELVLNPAPAPQLLVDSPVPVPQVNPPGPVVDRPVRNRRPPRHLKDCVVKSKYAPLKDLSNA